MNRPILLLLLVPLLLELVIFGYAQNCSFTVAGGPKVGVKCKFPFKFRGKVYNACTADTDPDKRKWCSTNVTENGNVHIGNKGYWGYCDQRCPVSVISSPTTTRFTTRRPQRRTLPTRFSTARPRRTRPPTTTPATTTPKPRRQTQAFPTTQESRPPVVSKPAEDSTQGDWLPDPNKFECATNLNSEFIVNGIDAKVGQFPFMALLGYRRPGVNKILYLCGGTLINRRYVVTAAHCHTSRQQIFEVVLGEHIVGKFLDCLGCAQPQRFYPRSSDITIHPKFNFDRVTDQGNDIALIRLPNLVISSVENPDYFIVPACLPWNRKFNDREDNHYVAGWGKTTQRLLDTGDFNVAGVFERNLQFAEVPLVPANECRRISGLRIVNPRSHICAGGPNSPDSCSGDSGGPLISRRRGQEGAQYFLRGIVSYGTTPCAKGKPGVYTDIEIFLPWIRQNLKP